MIMPNNALPKAELRQYNYTDGSNSSFVILLSSSAEIPVFGCTPSVGGNTR